MWWLALLVACSDSDPAPQLRTLTEVSAEAAEEADPPCHHEEAPEAAAATEGSIYDLDLDLVDQRGTAVGLDVDRGHPTLVTMMYGSCTAVCPMIVGKIQAVEAALDPAVRDDLRVVLVSLDPERDNPATLLAMADRHGVDGSRWTFATTSPDGVQDLAAVLGIQWRKDPGGDIRHSTVITLVDGNGVPIERITGLGDPEAAMVAAISGLGRS